MVRFLIVDDENSCRELLAILLSRYGQCDMAHDGREGGRRLSYGSR